MAQNIAKLEMGAKEMTNQKAKDLTIEVWQYLADHPKIKYKADLPKKLWNKIKFLTCQCPLCEITDANCNLTDETCCPLFNCNDYCKNYNRNRNQKYRK